MKQELASLLGKFYFERISSSLNSFNLTFLFHFYFLLKIVYLLKSIFFRVQARWSIQVDPSIGGKAQ